MPDSHVHFKARHIPSSPPWSRSGRFCLLRPSVCGLRLPLYSHIHKACSASGGGPFAYPAPLQVFATLRVIARQTRTTSLPQPRNIFAMGTGRPILSLRFRLSSTPAKAIPYMQTSFTALQMCVGVGKIIYHLRLVSTGISLLFAARFDGLSAQYLRRLAGGVLPDGCVVDIRLPLTFLDASLDIGLTAAVDVTASSFISSVIPARQLLARFLPFHTHTCFQDPGVPAVITTLTDFVVAQE